MTPLRKRMVEDMQLRGLSARTQEGYVRAVRQLAEHFRRSPDRLEDEQLREYFLYLTNEKGVSRGTTTIALCAIKFLYQKSLGRDWPTLHLVRPSHKKKLPIVLSKEEVWRILHAVTTSAFRICLITIYSCGLRAREGVRLRPENIDGARAALHIRGKGQKDRYIPLPTATLDLLRVFWKSHRSPDWLFVRSVGDPSKQTAQRQLQRISYSGLASALTAAARRSGVTKHVHPHMLRHSYATHLLEEGVNLRLIQRYLGHGNLGSTAVYTHLTQVVEQTARDPINHLTDGL